MTPHVLQEAVRHRHHQHAETIANTACYVKSSPVLAPAPRREEAPASEPVHEGEVAGLLKKAAASVHAFHRRQAAHAAKIASLRTLRRPAREHAEADADRFAKEQAAALAGQDHADVQAPDIFNALADFAEAHGLTFEQVGLMASVLFRRNLVPRHALHAWVRGGRAALQCAETDGLGGAR